MTTAISNNENLLRSAELYENISEAANFLTIMIKASLLILAPVIFSLALNAAVNH